MSYLVSGYSAPLFLRRVRNIVVFVLKMKHLASWSMFVFFRMPAELKYATSVSAKVITGLHRVLDEEEIGTGMASQPRPPYKFKAEQWLVWADAETNKNFWFRAQWYRAIFIE